MRMVGASPMFLVVALAFSALTAEAAPYSLDVHPSASGRSRKTFTVRVKGAAGNPQLFVIRDDLKWFHHLHASSDNAAEFTVPTNGRYTVYAVDPKNADAIVKQELRVGRFHLPSFGGGFDPRVRSRRSGKLDILLAGPEHGLRTGEPVVVEFLVLRHGDPVTYLTSRGDFGHLIAVERDRASAAVGTAIYPPSYAPGPGNATGGPSFQFRLRFPHSGDFRLWLELYHAEHSIDVPFDVHVE